MVETRGGRRFAILFIVAAFAVLLLGRWIRPVDSIALTATAPFAAVASGVAGTVGDVVSGVFQGPGLYQENQQLRKTVGKLLRENVAYQYQLRDYKLLSRMQQFETEHAQATYLPAQVIGSSPDPIAPYIFIDKGRRDQLQQGMTVVDQNGYFVGSVSEVLGNSSKVMLFVNPSSSVGAVDMATHAGGLVEGKYGGKAVLDQVVTSAQLHHGDVVVTSGLMNQYPRGLLIGQVTGVQRQNVSLFQQARLRPFADLQGLEIVQVIRSYHPSDFVKRAAAQ